MFSINSVAHTNCTICVYYSKLSFFKNEKNKSCLRLIETLQQGENCVCYKNLES